MGRPRKHGKDLPKRMHFKHGQFYFFRRDGKWVPLGRDKTAALHKYVDLLNAADPEEGTFPKFIADVWEKDASWGLLRYEESTTQIEYRRIAGHLKRHFRAFNTDEVQAVDIAQVLDAKGHRPRMANVYKTVLQSIFKLAKRKGERNDIPTEGIEDFTEAKRTRYITDDELRAIRGAAMVGKDGKMTPSGPMAQTMMDLCYLTAQRIDDILNLKKTDVSDDGIFFHPAKTVNSTGIKIRIQMSDAIRQALNRIRNYGQEGVTSLYVIHTLEGQPCTYWWARSAWDRAVERSGVTNPEGTHIHDLKAKALTDAKKAGQNAQALGGHADPRMTEHYIKNRIVLDVEPVKSRIFEA